MAGQTLSVPGFGGGIVLEAAADTARTDELRSCDAFDIGPRGSLICARDLADYVTLDDLQGSPAPWSRLHGLRTLAGSNYAQEAAVGEGKDVGGILRYFLAQFAIQSSSSPVGGAAVQAFPAHRGGVQPIPVAQGIIATFAKFSGVFTIHPGGGAAAQVNVFLVNLGAREAFAANTAPGLYVVYAVPAGTTWTVLSIDQFDSLGTGPDGEFAGGASSVQLYPRGVTAYNGFAWCWGFDASDLVLGEGPARAMFSNFNIPFKWGNDNIAPVGGNRGFTDSDAVLVGDGGEIIRAGIAWDKRLWFGTDKKLHFIAGFGRDTYTTDNVTPVANAENCIGANCLIEGPDKLLYGVGDNGLWAFDGNTFNRWHRRMRDYGLRSSGFWDLIWNDRTRGDTYPGKTNADLVWMAVDWDNEQVIVGIPWCNVVAGAGFGNDTAILKFHPKSGGFSRQYWTGVQYTAADYLRRQRQTATAKFIGTATAGVGSVRKYGSLDAGAGLLPTPLPSMEVWPYALAGPDGLASYRKHFLTLSWDPQVGTGGANGWQLQTGAGNFLWLDITWSPDLNLFVAVAETDAGTHHIMSSSDGKTWALRTTTDKHYTCICWSHEKALFIALAAFDDVFMSSPDGITWTEHALPASGNQWTHVAWNANASGGLFVGVDAGADSLTSPDGVAWTLHAGALPEPPFGICAASTKFVATGSLHSLSSSDGVTWATDGAFPVDPGGAGIWAGMNWSVDSGALVVVGAGATYSSARSTDLGVTWVGSKSVPGVPWKHVIWAHTNAIWMAVGAQTGTTGAMFSADDGVTWTAMVVPGNYTWERLAYADSLKRFVAVRFGEADQFDVMTLDPGNGPPSLTPNLQFAMTPVVDERQLPAVNVFISSTDPSTAITTGLLAIGRLGLSPINPKQFQLGTSPSYAITAAVNTLIPGSFAFTAAHQITAAGFGIILVQVNAAGVVSTKVPASPQNYGSAALALAALPAPDAGNIELGYLVIQAGGGNWNANTSNLTTDPASVTYTDGPLLAQATNVGDVWVDLSETDTNLGNATAGAFIAAEKNYIVKRWKYGWKWAGLGGQKGARITFPIGFTPGQGTRLGLVFNTVAADRRFQIEALGFPPVAGKAAMQ